jgi:hypothetical protein
VSVARAARSDDLASFVARLRPGAPIALGADVVVPVLLEGGGPDADLLDEGIAAGITALREVNEHGEVGRVRVRHDGGKLLLLLDGDQLLGAKQNRVINASFLVAPGQEVDIPVSCVERGRWQYRARAFGASGVTMTGTARSRKLGRVSHSIITGSGYEADQAAVWQDVDDYLHQSRVFSATSSLDDGIAARKADTDQKLAALAPAPRQAGLALVRGGRVVLLDVFGSVDLYHRAWRKIAAGMLADSAEATTDPATAPALVAAALATIAGDTPVRRAAPGTGDTLHGEVAGLAYGAVAFEGAVYHAALAST